MLFARKVVLRVFINWNNISLRSKCGRLKNSHCSMTISAEHRSKFAAPHRQWSRLQMSEKFSSGTKTPNEKKTPILVEGDTDPLIANTCCCSISKRSKSSSPRWRRGIILGVWGLFWCPLHTYPMFSCEGREQSTYFEHCLMATIEVYARYTFKIYKYKPPQ